MIPTFVGSSVPERLRCYTQTENLHCILHNLLIKNPVPPDWFDYKVWAFDQEDKLNQPVDHSNAYTRCN